MSSGRNERGRASFQTYFSISISIFIGLWSFNIFAFNGSWEVSTRGVFLVLRLLERGFRLGPLSFFFP